MFRSNNPYLRHVRSHLNPKLRTLQQQSQPPRGVTTRRQSFLRNGPSLSTLCFIEERQAQRQVQIEAVPPLHEALHDSRHEKRKPRLQKNTKGFHNTLRSYEDGQHLLSKEWIFPAREEESSDRPAPAGFNAITARLHKLGLDLRPRNIFYGILCAYQDPAALKQYLMMLQTPRADDSLAVKEFAEFFEHIAPKLRKRRVSRWQKSIHDEQWFNVITGLADNELVRVNAPRELSLYDLGPGLDLKHWGWYINVVDRILGIGTTYLEFLRFKNQGAAQSGFEEGDTNFIKWVLNPTVQHLAKGNDPEHAWELARELEDPSKGIHPRTWKALLAHPDYVRTWIPKMFPKMNGSKLESLEEQVMGMSTSETLEHEVRQLEMDMGLSWRGGEDGYHTTTTNSRFLPGFTAHVIDEDSSDHTLDLLEIEVRGKAIP